MLKIATACGTAVEPGIAGFLRSELGLRLGADVTEGGQGTAAYRIGFDMETDPGLAASDGYRLSIDKGGARVSATSGAGLLAGAGHYMRLCQRAGGIATEPLELTVRPAIPWRVVYAPGHFRNSYEEASREEMAEHMRQAALWGINAWGEWFDTNDMTNPYGSEASDSEIPMLFWEAKKAALLAARDAGLRVQLVLTPNHVFVDQVRDDIRAVKTSAARAGQAARRVIGNLVCPSKPAARRIILDNCRTLFDDLKASGVRLNLVSFAFYDNGGCLCDACHPWLETSLELDREIAGILRRFYPECGVDLCGRYLSGDEVQWVQRQRAEGALEWADGLQIALCEGKRDVSAMALLEGMKRELFINLGYSANNVDDAYGLCGAVVAPRRVARIVTDAVWAGCQRIFGYGEGTHDDVNKVLMARLATEPAANPMAVLEEYGRWYLGMRGGDAPAMARVLEEMETLAYRDDPGMAAELRRLAAKAGDAALSWRFRHLSYRAELCAMDAGIGRPLVWSAELADTVEKATETEIRGAAEGFLSRKAELMGKRDAAYRRMNREVYGLGRYSMFLSTRTAAWEKWAREARGRISRIPAEEASSYRESWVRGLRAAGAGEAGKAPDGAQAAMNEKRVVLKGRDVALRQLRPEDERALGDYFLGLSMATRMLYGPHPFDRETARKLCSEMGTPAEAAALRLVAEARGKIVAYSILFIGPRDYDRKRYGGLDAATSCAIAPSVADEWQDKGLGSEMMQFAQDVARSMGRKSMILAGGVQARNERGVHFYRKHGFRTVREFDTQMKNYDMVMDLASNTAPIS